MEIGEELSNVSGTGDHKQKIDECLNVMRKKLDGVGLVDDRPSTD